RKGNHRDASPGDHTTATPASSPATGEFEIELRARDVGFGSFAAAGGPPACAATTTGSLNQQENAVEMKQRADDSSIKHPEAAIMPDCSSTISLGMAPPLLREQNEESEKPTAPGDAPVASLTRTAGPSQISSFCVLRKRLDSVMKSLPNHHSDNEATKLMVRRLRAVLLKEEKKLETLEHAVSVNLELAVQACATDQHAVVRAPSANTTTLHDCQAELLEKIQNVENALALKKSAKQTPKGGDRTTRYDPRGCDDPARRRPEQDAVAADAEAVLRQLTSVDLLALAANFSSREDDRAVPLEQRLDRLTDGLQEVGCCESNQNELHLLVTSTLPTEAAGGHAFDSNQSCDKLGSIRSASSCACTDL
ncbi:unnamed protein product, partial [Amoebophrya sp. A120]